MPKAKTHKGSEKRFKKTGSGKLKRQHSSARHLATSKSSKRKRHLRHSALVSKGDFKRIKRMVSNI